MDLVGFELDPFLDSVLVDVLSTFVRIVTHPLRPSAGFLFDLEKRVDVREHGDGIAFEMPDVVHVFDDVTSIDGFLQFGSGPCTYKTPLLLVQG